jgi:hypothetical protein
MKLEETDARRNVLKSMVKQTDLVIIEIKDGKAKFLSGQDIPESHMRESQLDVDGVFRAVPYTCEGSDGKCAIGAPHLECAMYRKKKCGKWGLLRVEDLSVDINLVFKLVGV